MASRHLFAGAFGLLLLVGCSSDPIQQETPDCAVPSAPIRFGRTLRPLVEGQTETLVGVTTVSSVVLVRTVAGNRTLSGSVTFEVDSGQPDPPRFVILDPPDGSSFTLQPDQTLTFTFGAIIGQDTTPGDYTGHVDFGASCGTVPFELEVIAYQETPPVFERMWGVEGAERGQFLEPAGLDVDADGNLLVADRGNRAVMTFDPEGNLLSWIGGPGIRDYNMRIPNDVVEGPDRTLFVMDQGSGSSLARIMLFGEDGLLREIWSEIRTGPLMEHPTHIAMDLEENVYVLDPPAHRVRKFRDDDQRLGVVILGSWGEQGEQRGQLFGPAGLAVSPVTGQVYVSDRKRHRILRYSSSGEFLGEFGFTGSLPGEFLEPRGLDFDAQGNLFVVDSGNNRVQKLDPEGRFITLFGRPGWREEELYLAEDVAVGPDGSVYVSDTGHVRIQKWRFVDGPAAPGGTSGRP